MDIPCLPECKFLLPGTALLFEIKQNYDEYYISLEWNSSYPAGNWDNSEYYDQYHSSSDSDSNSDYNWGSDGNWDSGGTDWDSDW